MKYRVHNMSKDGSGYLVITLDDGSTFGQNVRNCIVQSVEELDTFVADLVADLITKEAVAAAEVPPAVIAASRLERTVAQRVLDVTQGLVR